jgi:hypothetical protein
MSRELRSKPRPVPSPARRSVPRWLHPVLRFAASPWCDLVLHANCAQSATPWTIRLVRTIPKSVRQLFGLDKAAAKRLQRAEIVAIQRELRTSRASKSEMARVVQVPFAYCGPRA